MQVRSFGIVLSEFDEVLGPIPICSTNTTLDRKAQSHIATKTIDLLLQDPILPKKASLIDFPSLNKKALVKPFRWNDLQKRGMKGQGTISILIDNWEDTIFYKYRDDIEPIFSDFITNFILAREKNNRITTFTPQLEFLFHKVESLMRYLSETEMSNESNTEFPIDTKITEEPITSYKVIIVGDETVGKTSTILRYVDRAFRRSYIPTIGVNVTIKNFEYDHQIYQFMLWDLAGQSKFTKIRRHFYLGADAIILIFDLTQPETLKNIPKWYADLNDTIPDFAHKIKLLCGNKADLIEEIKVSKQDIQNEVSDLKIPYLEISALTGKSISLLFELIGQKLLERNIEVMMV